MIHILETCDPGTCVDAKGQPECEQEMSTEEDSLLKNHTWYSIS